MNASTLLDARALRELMNRYRISEALDISGFQPLHPEQIEAMVRAVPENIRSVGVLTSEEGDILIMLRSRQHGGPAPTLGAPDQLAVHLPSVPRDQSEVHARVSYFLLDSRSQSPVLLGKERVSFNPLILTPPLRGDLLIAIEFW